MRLSRNTAPVVGEKRDSPLFCTPPAGESPLNIGGPHNRDDEDVKDPESPGGALYEYSAPGFHPESTHGCHSIRPDGYRILRTFNLNTSNPEAATGVNLNFPTRPGSIGEKYTDMAPSGRSLTSHAVPFRSDPAPERHYLAHGITSDPHQVRANSLNHIPTSVATSESGPTKYQSLGQLTGYATSEDDEEKDPVREIKKPTCAKKTTYKSAELVGTESRSQSEDDQKVQCPEIQVDEPSKKLQISPRLASNRRNLQKPYKMSIKRGGSVKKRPLSPNASASVPKRPATKGGFVISSDESDNDIDDEPVQPESVAQQAPRPLIRPVPMQTALRATPETTPSLAKQVNRTRLNMLLGRNRNVTPAPRQSLPPSHSRGTLPQPTGSADPRRVSALSQVPHDKFPQRNQTRNATQSRNTGKGRGGGKEMESLTQQSVAPKPREAMPRITDTASSQARENERPLLVGKPLAREAPKAKSNAQPVRPATATVVPNSPQLQQRKPPQGANAMSEDVTVSANTKKTGATQPGSLLQAALDDMKKPATGSSSDAQPWTREDKKHKIRDASAFPSKTSGVSRKSFSTDASGSAAPMSSASSKPQASGTPVPKVPKIQTKQQGLNLSQKQQLSSILQESSRSSRSASSSAARPSQKRKVDDVSDDGGGTTVTASKKPAAPPVSTATKPANDDTAKSPLPVTKFEQRARDNGQPKKTDGASLATAVRSPPPVVASGSSGSEAKGTPREASLSTRQTANPTTIIPSISTTTTPNKVGKKQIFSNSSGSDATKSLDLKSGSKPLGTGIEKEHDAAHAADASKPGPLKTTGAVDETKSEAQKSGSSASVGSHRDDPANSSHSQRSGENFKGESSLSGGSGGTARPAHQDSMGTHTTPTPATSAVVEPSNPPYKSPDTHEIVPMSKSPSPAYPAKNLAPAELAPSPPIPTKTPTRPASIPNADISILPQPPLLHADAIPYFEYSIFQTHYSTPQEEKPSPSTEISLRPYTDISEANAQAERLFQSSRHFLDDMRVEHSMKKDENGCAVYMSHFAPAEYPERKKGVKVWVRRDAVSKLANRTAESFLGTGFISSSGYVVRLFKLVTLPESDSSSDSSTSASDAAQPLLRIYYPLPHARPQVYTTLASANRAARNLQIELGHQEEPRDALTKVFQWDDLVRLNAELERLNKKVVELEGKAELGQFEDKAEVCWKSRFNARGLGGDGLEVLVEKVGICGPRNV